MLPENRVYADNRSGGAAFLSGEAVRFMYSPQARRPPVVVTPEADLGSLPDTTLLTLLRPLPHGNARREAICEILVTRYRRLVAACVRQYRASPEPAEDLMQVGYVGLLKAICCWICAPPKTTSPSYLAAPRTTPN